MDKPLLNQGWKVRIPNGLRGVVRHIYYDDGWWAVVGRSCYRHEELEVIRANPVDVLRPAAPDDPESS